MSDTARRCAEFLARCFPEGGQWTEPELRAILERPGGQVFENDGGFVIVSRVLDEAEIWTIAISPERRREGLGTALLQLAESQLREQSVRTIFLEVAADNAAALALYGGLGYSEISRRPAYYRSSDGREAVDAIVMVKKLQEKL